MADTNKLITLDQLKAALLASRNYADKTFELRDRLHDDRYYLKTEVDTAIGNVTNTLESKSDVGHTHNSSDITKMTSYVKADAATAIQPTDTLNQAIGKLEKALENISSSEHRHDDLYLGIRATAEAAKKLEVPRNLTIAGEVTGTASFDGSSDATITATVANLASSKIVNLTGYVKPDQASAISSADNLNQALGKLEKALDGKQVAGSYAPDTHSHGDLYFTKQEITDKLTNIEGGGSASLEAAKSYTDTKISELLGADVSEALDTLKELGAALGDDANFAATITAELGKKADVKHPHDNATSLADGFMSKEDKAKLSGIAENANNYVHPTGAGNAHIPAGGDVGQILVNNGDGSVTWESPSAASDQKVNNTLNQTVKAYVTGATQGGIGEQVYDSGVYLTANAGELAADKFIGALEGNALSATTADSATTAESADVAAKVAHAMKATIGSTEYTFDGSNDILMEVNAAMLGAATVQYVDERTAQATTLEVNNMLNEVYDLLPEQEEQ